MLLIIIDIYSHRLIYNRRNRHLHDVIDNYRPLFHTDWYTTGEIRHLHDVIENYRHLFTQIDIQQVKIDTYTMLLIIIDIYSHRLIYNRRNRHLHDVIDNYRPLFTQIDIQQAK